MHFGCKTVSIKKIANVLDIGLQQSSKTLTETQPLCDSEKGSICKKKNLAETAYIAGPASPAFAGPLFSESTSLVSFPDFIGTHVLLKYACVYDVQLQRYGTFACSSCASQSSPTCRPIATTSV